MIHFINILSLLLTVLWNLMVLLGTIYLIDQRDWSPWTLVATLCFFARWRTLPEEKKVEENPNIIMDKNGNPLKVCDTCKEPWVTFPGTTCPNCKK